MRRRSLLALVLAACGGKAVIDGSSPGGANQTGAGGAGATGASSAASPPDCVVCYDVFNDSQFSQKTVCPGEHAEKYQALLACGCARCQGPELCDFFCTGEFVGGPCDNCLFLECFEERDACLEGSCLDCGAVFDEDEWAWNLCDGPEHEDYKTLIACTYANCLPICTFFWEGAHVDPACGACLDMACADEVAQCKSRR